MVEALDELEQLTVRIVSTIHDATAEQLDAFVERRGQLIDRIMANAASSRESESNRERVERILGYDALIVSHMQELKHEARRGLDKFDQARLHRHAYGGGSYSVDSIFYDKRK